MDINHLSSIAEISNYIKSFGLLAPLVAFGLFVIQAILPVFPYAILTAAGGLLFGFKLGFLLAWFGALTGACMAFWGCRLAGSEWVIKTIQTRFGYDIRQMDSSLAFWSILIARIVPVVPTPIINAVAALSGVPFWVFFFSSAMGKIPTALLYTGLGLCLFKIKDIRLTLFVVGLILILIVTGRYLGKKHLSTP